MKSACAARRANVAERLLDGADAGRHESLVVVRVRGWFDHKWLRYSGLGRVPFASFRLSHPGVSLDDFWQDKLTVPPFSPARIVRETHFVHANCDPLKTIHRRRWRSSAQNLHRRVEHHGRSLMAGWVSTGSDSTGQASVMIYTHREGVLGAFYIGFHRSEVGWRPHRVKGIGRSEVACWLRDAPAPSSGTSTTLPTLVPAR